MKSNKYVVILFVLLASGLVLGCKSKKRAARPLVLESLSFEELIEKVHENHADFQTFSARISAQASFAKSEYTFNGALRIVKDSAIFISATVSLLGEVARAVITPDSLKFINRMESTYFVGDITFLNRLLGANVDYHMLQALLTGNDITHFSYNNPQVSTDKHNHVATIIERLPIANPFDDPLQNRIWVSDKTHRITQNMFLNLSTNRMVRATYKNHSLFNGQLLPVEMDLFFSEPANNIFVSLQLTRVVLNSPVQIAFSVPMRYRPFDGDGQ